MAQDRYIKPGRLEVRLLHRAVGWLAQHGVSLAGSRELSVRGRKSGEWRRTPVNPLTIEGRQYLVAPRGNTQWVRNLRAAGDAQLRIGRRTQEFTATEIADDDKPELLRAYLKRWKWEVGAFFDGVGPDSPEDDLRAIAPQHPIFLIRPTN